MYHDAQTFKEAEQENLVLRQGGLDRYAVSDQEIHAIEPALAPRFYGGFFTPSDSTGDIRKFTRGLADACARQGVTFLFGGKVRGITNTASGVSVQRADARGHELPPLECAAVVVCAGVGSRRLASMVGDRINIYPVKGYSITVCLEDSRSQKAAPWVSLLDDQAKIVTSRRDGEIPGRWNSRVQWLQQRHPRRPHRTFGAVVPQAVPRHEHRHGNSLGGAASDDPQYDAAGWARQTARHLLQHGSRPPGLDVIRGDGRCDFGAGGAGCDAADDQPAACLGLAAAGARPPRIPRPRKVHEVPAAAPLGPGLLLRHGRFGPAPQQSSASGGQVAVITRGLVYRGERGTVDGLHRIVHGGIDTGMHLAPAAQHGQVIRLAHSQCGLANARIHGRRPLLALHVDFVVVDDPLIRLGRARGEEANGAGCQQRGSNRGCHKIPLSVDEAIRRQCGARSPAGTTTRGNSGLK